MAERQAHGLTFESICQKAIAPLVLSKSYTSSIDGKYSAGENREIGVSIKTVKGRGEICLASFKRIVECQSPTVFIVGNYKKDEPVDRVKIYYLPLGFAPLFGDKGQYAQQAYDYVADYQAYMFEDENFAEYGNGFNDYGYDKIWKQERKKRLEQYRSIFDDRKQIIIHPRPKRDHKHQRRLQCAIPYRCMPQFASSPFVISSAASIALSAANLASARSVIDELIEIGDNTEYKVTLPKI